VPDPDLFPGVQIHHKGGTYAVLDAGAHVLNWTPPGQQPVLWESPLARFEPGVAVRGGVPVIFPWFSAGLTGDRTPAHGFARTANWVRESLTDDVATTGRLQVVHSLTADGFDSAPFDARLIAEFAADQLRVQLVVTNPGPDVFTYEEALHTYFAISDIGRISIDGLDGCAYQDKVTGTAETQAGGVRFSGRTDRIYTHAGEATIDDPGRGRRIHVGKEGSANTVVWNPGRDLAMTQRDIGDYYAEFVCVEAANVGASAITLDPGETHAIAQVVRLS